MMRFLVDAQLPPALARRLEQSGHPAEHVADCQMTIAEDDVIRKYAASIGAVLVTKDEDFAVRQSMRVAGPAIVWIRFSNTRRLQLRRQIEAIFPYVIVALERGETLIELI